MQNTATTRKASTGQKPTARSCQTNRTPRKSGQPPNADREQQTKKLNQNQSRKYRRRNPRLHGGVSRGAGNAYAPTGGAERKKAGGYLLSRESSIIGARGLDFRVRYGNGYDTSAVATGKQCRVMGQRAASEPAGYRRGGTRHAPGRGMREGRGRNDNMAKPHGLLVLLG